MTNLNFNRQRGLSIIELMIALLISSILILGITQVYLDSKRNHMYHQGQTANLDTSRFSAMVFEDVLSKAGYRRNPERNMREAFPARGSTSGFCSAFQAGHVVTTLDGTNKNGLCIRYQPAVSGEQLCDGTTASLGTEKPFRSPQSSEQVVLALKFVPGATNQEDGHITCRSNKGTSEVQLIEGIADVRVFFAVGDGVYLRLKNGGYQKADGWTSSDGVVRAIRFELLSANGRGTRDGESAIYTNWLEQADNASKTRLNNLDQRHIYQQVVGSQAIRNMMP